MRQSQILEIQQRMIDDLVKVLQRDPAHFPLAPQVLGVCLVTCAQLLGWNKTSFDAFLHEQKRYWNICLELKLELEGETDER